MASFETASTHSFAGRVGVSFSALVALLIDWNEKRMTRRALEKLNDRMLEDIGMCRADVARLR